MSVQPNAGHARVAIIGTGFSGLGAALALQRAGIDFVLFERRGDLGGTWLDNSYPGCTCDVPSHLYSFSFALNPDWTHTYSSQADIWAYLKELARRYEILPHIRFNHELLGAAWDEDARRWRIETSQGAWTADVLITACGALSEPAIPSLPGLENFTGTMFHSAQWNHGHQLSGERVAVIGTGASAIQFVPKIQPIVKRLHLFQRTPAWILSHPNRRITDFERAVYRHIPLLQRAVRAGVYWSRELLIGTALTRHVRLTRLIARAAGKHLARQVQDENLRRKLTPSYLPGCKRILISNDFYPAISESNAELVTEQIREVRAHSIVTEDGREREIDAIIFGTGFRVTSNPFALRVQGRDGKTLATAWSESGGQAYRGTTVPGFPNLFLMTGPNTGIGHTSLLVMIEAQLGYIVACLRHMQKRRLASFELQREPYEAFNREIRRKMQHTVWLRGGCASWYLDSHGRNTTLWPDFTWKYRRLMRRFDAENYEFSPVAA
ncbi:MAG TPA: NAD(P)/FAD-dependent oxidoreductase, partial [Pirellulales bacterium]|nr:NAD(P)/FAD-dependent oxidoreductase [Pirellulales bacterium]